MLVLLGIVALLQVVSLTMIVLTLKKQTDSDSGALRVQCETLEKGQVRLEALLRDEIAANRREIASGAKETRDEIGRSLKELNERFVGMERATNQSFERLIDKSNGALQSFAAALSTQLNDFFTKQNERLEALKVEQVAGGKSLRQETGTAIQSLGELLGANQRNSSNAQREQMEQFSMSLSELVQSAKNDAAQLRATLQGEMKNVGDSLLRQTAEVATLQKNQLDAFGTHLTGISRSSEEKLDKMRLSVEERLQALQADNSQKLDQMRATVDEKLQSTLEKRLSESFTQVSERLEQVHRGLGEMQVLANGVGDLKKVLSNVKMRGTWGEIQLGNLLEQVLTRDQFECNVAVKPGDNERVEFAIKLPGHDEEQAQVWLPIDAKFPQEDYARLVDAQEIGDLQGIEAASKGLEMAVRASAAMICSKYIAPPHTTDFAIMFLPTEGLYAEVVRRTGLVEVLQRDCRVIIAGPTTLAALLNSLQMGFRTLAIQKRSSEVWAVLGAVKTEFGKYADVLDKVKKKLQEASNTVESASTRTRVIERNLRRVETLPQVGVGQLALVADPVEEILETIAESA